jgi:nucleoside-diphosphate-sugar epimerase
MTLPAKKIVITGAAGLIGQNLIVRLKRGGAPALVGIDKHPTNTAVLARLHPDIGVVHADLATDDGWQAALDGADTLVIAHAQIGGEDAASFEANNITATSRLLEAARAAGVGHVVHLSSSVVNSAAIDLYTETKKAQEALVLATGIPCVVLRPTLMFGWFDRKHLGWLARFMRRVPLFPIPGDGKYRRQPLYAGDFCEVIIACIERRVTGAVYNISGREIIDYIDLIRAVRDASGARVPIIRIPFWLFRLLLRIYAVFNSNPPFTTKQLAALSIPELFEIIDWPDIFGVTATRLEDALRETFTAEPYASIVLDF